MPRSPVQRPLRGEVSAEDIQRGKRFAAWLRRAREAKGWLKKDVAAASGVSNTYIGVLENDGINNSTGQYQRPSEDVIEKLSISLGANEDTGRKAAGYGPRSPGATPLSLDDPEVSEIVAMWLSAPASRQKIAREILQLDDTRPRGSR